MTSAFGVPGMPSGSEFDLMRTINGDQTTADGSKFFDDPEIDHEGEVANSSDEEPQINYSQRVPYADHLGMIPDSGDHRSMGQSAQAAHANFYIIFDRVRRKDIFVNRCSARGWVGPVLVG